MKAATAGRLLVALALASVMIGGLSVGTARGEDRRWVQQNRGGYERDRHDGGRWHGPVWHDNGGWRDSRGWHSYRPVYAPPPVVYGPPASPGISIFFPFFR